jgi:hypothetical protein
MTTILDTYTCHDGNGTITHTWAVDTTKPVMWREGNFYRFNRVYVGNTVTKNLHHQHKQEV